MIEPGFRSWLFFYVLLHLIVDMTMPRHGDRFGFFDGTTTYNASTNLGGGVGVTGSNSFSKIAEIGHSADDFAIYISVTGSPAFVTDWVLQASHSGGWTSEGVYQDKDSLAQSFHDAWYLGTTGTGNSTLIKISIPSGGGAIMSIIPDFSPGYVRLKRTDANGAVTVTAGWEIASG